MHAYYTIGFSTEEKEELLSILSNHPKWIDRIKNAGGFGGSGPGVRGVDYELVDNGEQPSGIIFLNK